MRFLTDEEFYLLKRVIENDLKSYQDYWLSEDDGPAFEVNKFKQLSELAEKGIHESVVPFISIGSHNCQVELLIERNGKTLNSHIMGIALGDPENDEEARKIHDDIVECFFENSQIGENIMSETGLDLTLGGFEGSKLENDNIGKFCLRLTEQQIIEMWKMMDVGVNLMKL